MNSQAHQRYLYHDFRSSQVYFDYKMNSVLPTTGRRRPKFGYADRSIVCITQGMLGQSRVRDFVEVCQGTAGRHYLQSFLLGRSSECQGNWISPTPAKPLERLPVGTFGPLEYLCYSDANSVSNLTNSVLIFAHATDGLMGSPRFLCSSSAIA